MLSLRQHFQRIKEIVDWSWTLAILCMAGYITLGQLAQLYWAMVFFGGLAASFGLFYDFSCEKLAELNAIEDEYQLNKAFAASALAQDLLRKFADRNPEIPNQFPDFIQLKNQVSNIKKSSADRIKQRINRPTSARPNRSSQPSSQKPAQPTTPSSPPRKQPQPPQINSFQPPFQKPAQPTTPSSPPPKQPQPPQQRATESKISEEEYRRIVNQRDYTYVKGYLRSGHWVRAHYRRKPNLSQPKDP
ncbi:MAG: hypothetical protein HEQ19_28205 [Gloeotrichia echinulata CP02]|jgi:hypothetical protein|nr:hypothetical protein [Gloeotrichia echinulata DEX184]